MCFTTIWAGSTSWTRTTARRAFTLYDFTSASWWYTSPGFGFPYLYDFTRRTVLYYYPAIGQSDHGSSGPRYFYDFASKQIITL